MEKELLRLAEEASKSADIAAKVNGVCIDKDPEVCRCVSLLKKLKDFPVSFEVLASTQVDKRLRHLRNHNNEKVRLMAKWLLEIWSLTIKSGLLRNQRNGVTSSVKTCKVELTKSRNDEPSRYKRKRESKERIEKEERSFSCFEKPVREPKVSKQTATDSIKCSDASRNKVREIIAEALRKVECEVAEEDKEEMKEKVRACDPVAVAASVESLMFKKLGPFNGLKKLKYRSIMFNVKDPKNRDFRRKILLGDVKPERLVTMTTEEMPSNELQCKVNHMKEQALSKIQESVEETAGKSNNEAVWLDSLW